MGWSTMASWCPKDSTAGEAMGAQVKKGNVTNIKSGRCKQKNLEWGFNAEIIAVFLWDQERELGFVYIPTYLAW